MSPLTNLPAKVRDKLAESRFFTISLILHLILVALVGSTILYVVDPPPPEFAARQLVEKIERLPEKPVDQTDLVKSLDPTKGLSTPSLPPEDYPKTITTPNPSDFSVPKVDGPGSKVASEMPKSPVPKAPEPGAGQLSKGDLARIREFTDWKTNDSAMSPTYNFTAFLGKYRGGNWSSTVRLTNGEITGGSLPNLLYCTSKWSKDKISTNERQVKAIALDSEELFVAKPPFIFLTGTKDFVLTDKEVENLRKYITCGGAIWGDSSVPGHRSGFDVAFRREMKRVLPDIDKEFTALPADHPVFTQGYFKKITALPSGVNQYREPVEVMRYGGEVAVIHTLNDYGDMWQIGLDKDGKIDLSRNARGEYVAMNQVLWEQKDLYVRNIDQPAVEEAYKFGINMIVHLLTRWENRTASMRTL